jgi:hypothetical protein
MRYFFQARNNPLDGTQLEFYISTTRPERVVSLIRACGWPTVEYEIADRAPVRAGISYLNLVAQRMGLEMET